MVPAGETLYLQQVLEANLGRDPAPKQSWFFRETSDSGPIQENQLHESAADQRTPSHSQEAGQGNGDRFHHDGDFERTFKITVMGPSPQSAPECASRLYVTSLLL